MVIMSMSLRAGTAARTQIPVTGDLNNSRIRIILREVSQPFQDSSSCLVALLV